MDRSMIQYVLINNTRVPLCYICDQPVELDPLPYAKPTARLLCREHQRDFNKIDGEKPEKYKKSSGI